MKMCVTGGAGFIGSHLVKRLLDDGSEVSVVDDLSRGCLANLSDLGVNVDVDRTDLRDYDKTVRALKSADVVFHLAARVGSVDYLHGSSLAELEAFQDNVRIDANVFRACMKWGVGKIIFASSVSVYPIDKQTKHGAVFSEEDLTYYAPDGGYGWAKLLGEYQLKLIEDIKISIARIFNIYGPCSAIDETAQVIPALMKKAIRYPKEDFIVWGDGDATRDFTYVSDCADALMLLEEKASNPPLTVNVGSDKPVSIGELAGKIVRVSKKGMNIRYDESKPVGTISRTANIGRISKLGWKPKVDLNEGLRLTYGWLKKRIVQDEK